MEMDGFGCKNEKRGFCSCENCDLKPFESQKCNDYRKETAAKCDVVLLTKKFKPTRLLFITNDMNKIEEDFEGIAKFMIKSGELKELLSLIPDLTKKEIVDNWKGGN